MRKKNINVDDILYYWEIHSRLKKSIYLATMISNNYL